MHTSHRRYINEVKTMWVTYNFSVHAAGSRKPVDRISSSFHDDFSPPTLLLKQFPIKFTLDNTLTDTIYRTDVPNSMFFVLFVDM